MSLDKWLEIVKQCKALSERNILRLCKTVKELLVEESTVQPISSPVNILGDIHGQFYDLMDFFEIGGEMPQKKYIFLVKHDFNPFLKPRKVPNFFLFKNEGGIVNRCYWSVETLTYLLLLKAMYPSRILLLRGSHEVESTTRIYSFYNECREIYGTDKVWRNFIELFGFLPLAALIDGSVYCVHSGLSAQIEAIDELRTLDRWDHTKYEDSTSPHGELLWNNPEEIEGWQLARNSLMYGQQPVDRFTKLNRVELIVRGHQLVMEGYNLMFEKKNLVCLWSSCNFLNRCGNLGALLMLDERLQKEFLTKNMVEESGTCTPPLFANEQRFF